MSHRNGDPGREARIRTSVRYLPCVEPSNDEPLPANSGLALARQSEHRVLMSDDNPFAELWSHSRERLRAIVIQPPCHFCKHRWRLLDQSLLKDTEDFWPSSLVLPQPTLPRKPAGNVRGCVLFQKLSDRDAQRVAQAKQEIDPRSMLSCHHAPQHHAGGSCNVTKFLQVARQVGDLLALAPQLKGVSVKLINIGRQVIAESRSQLPKRSC